MIKNERDLKLFIDTLMKSHEFDEEDILYNLQNPRYNDHLQVWKLADNIVIPQLSFTPVSNLEAFLRKKWTFE